MEEHDFKHFENSLGQIYCSIRYHDRFKMVTVTWKGTAQPGGIEKVKDEVLELARKKDCLFLINDVQDFYTAATETLIGFIKSGWNEEAFAAGLHYILHIVKPEAEIPPLPETESQVIKFFHSKLEAVEWVEQELERMNPE